VLEPGYDVRKIDRAQMLLAAGKQSVKEIAWQLHFGHECYFSSFFKPV
jgi:AraC-like DNA-binding protein